MKKTRNAIAILMFAIAFVGCAWWQRHESQIACAGITSVKDGAQLITIVTVCAEVAADVNAILPCIQGAAGSKWAAEVVACFAGAVAGLTSCPAIPPSAPPIATGARERLQGAVHAQGYRFAP